MLAARELDVANVSSVEYAHNPERYVLLPSLCVGSDGAVESVQLVTQLPLPAVRSIAVTSHSATSVALVQVLVPHAEILPEGEPADARLLIGDAALQSAFSDPTPHHDLGALWRERTGLPMVFAVWAAQRDCDPGALARIDRALSGAVAEASEHAGSGREGGRRAARLPGRLPRALLREAPLRVRRARARRARALLRAGRRARGDCGRARAALRRHRSRTLIRMAVDVATRPVQAILEQVLEGSRLSDDDAAALLRSRDLVSVGRAADEMRSRKSDPDEVTFIVDRNINYTNVCVTDCDFCAFYRRPGDTREGYVLPKPVIHKKIEETLALGGTAVLMQGGHHPDLGIEWYEDLFSGIK